MRRFSDRYSHSMPTMQVAAMGRLDAMLGRSLLDAPDAGEDEAQAQELWLDADPAAFRPARGVSR